MIAASVVEQIREFVAGGERNRTRIARRLGIDRRTVTRVVRLLRCGRETAPKPGAPPARCPGCGGLGHGQCMRCRLEREPRRRVVGPADWLVHIGRVGLELRPHHRPRYDEVVAARRRGQPIGGDGDEGGDRGQCWPADEESLASDDEPVVFVEEGAVGGTMVTAAFEFEL